MNVLSLFDGMSCGQIALERAGIKVSNYFASEIDKYAIKVAQSNYPNTIQLGDITQWQNWDLPKIDLLIGGSPCQGFSFAGKQLNFDDPRSKLFFEFVNVLKFYKPKYFLLENVKMKKEFQNIISESLDVEPIEINSSLVSAQNRRRLYWTNIPNVSQPEDKKIYLKDIIEYGLVDRDKSSCVEANQKISCGRIVNRRLDRDGKRDDYNLNIPLLPKLELKTDNKSNCITTVQKDNVIVFENIKECVLKNLEPQIKEINPGKNRFYQLKCESGFQDNKISITKTPSLRAGNSSIYGKISDFYYRKLTPIECERLQTVPDNYTDCVSNAQRYKMLGNGWTVDVISHIFKYM